MTTEKHDPWALLREARDQLVGVQGMGKVTQTIARIDAALAEHDTPVVESDESNAVWRAYANRELSEDEAKAKLAALEAKSAALAGRAEGSTECAVEWRPADQRVFLDGVNLRVVHHQDGLWVWSVYWPLSHRTEQGRVATEAEAKSAAIRAAGETK